MAKYDSHVRARRAILRRIVNRAHDWGCLWTRKASDAACMWTAARKLAAYSQTAWPSYAFTKVVGRYPNQRTVPAKNISSVVIHSIMCTRED